VGSFVTREDDNFFSYNITRFIPTDACHKDSIRNNKIRVPGEMCEESLYDNYEKANQNIGSLLDFPQTSKEIEKPAGFPNWDSGFNGSFLGPTPT
jgi:hypothetical protein